MLKGLSATSHGISTPILALDENTLAQMSTPTETVWGATEIKRTLLRPEGYINVQMLLPTPQMTIWKSRACYEMAWRLEHSS